MKEKLIQFIWQNRLYGTAAQYTTEGKYIEIISPGFLNADAGPDFFDARVKIDDLIWVGNVEIHIKASDWLRHGHQNSKAYSNTILHVVLDADAEIKVDDRIIPQLQLNFPPYLWNNYNDLILSSKWLACQDKIQMINSFELSAWLNRMMIERLEYKTNSIYAILEQTNNDWSETFYRVLFRSFGFKTNALPFELLAKSLPLRILGRHRNSLKQIEALLFGQAGLLLGFESSDEYYADLTKEYQFLSQKYGLKPLDASLWKWAKMRPSNFPTIRLAQLAQLIFNSENLFSKLLEAETIESVYVFFEIQLQNPYWETHFQFDKISKKTRKSIGNQSVYLLIINVVVPILFAYAQKNNSEIIAQRVNQFLDEIEAEDNSIIRNFNELGLKATNAGDSQAYLHLYNNYCSPKKCAVCAIGQRLIIKNNSVLE